MDSNKGYKAVNGLKMYYEIHGEGMPLVLIHGGGSTIGTTFGRVLPLFAKNRQVIAVELQAHGHTEDRGTPTSFEQDAGDVAGLLKKLNIPVTDVFGFSNGANTAMQMAIRHPELVRKLILASGFFKRSGIPQQFWDFMKNAHIDHMPAQLKEAFLEINPNPQALQTMHDRDAYRMQTFTDWPEDSIRSIVAPTLVINGDQDVITVEHATEIYRLLPNGRLFIYPGVHGDFIGELIVKASLMSPDMSVTMIEKFLQ